MNEVAKEHLRRTKQAIVDTLEANFPHIPLYEDEVPTEETEKYNKGQAYLLFVLKMGPMNKQENVRYLTQSFSVDYYAENTDTVDEVTLDIISLMKTIKTVTFANSEKFRARHADTKRYVDIVSLNFGRMTKIEC